jgi:putative DNA-invertase from lambdoid prophage Rac
MLGYGALKNEGLSSRVCEGFWPGEIVIMRVGLYARVSTHDQHTLPMQREAMHTYIASRGWTLVKDVEDVGSGVTERPQRETLIQAARRRELDVIVVWRLDRWGRSLADLAVTLTELSALEVGFVSLTEAIDLTTPSGRALAGMLAVFAEFERELLRERIKAGIAHARQAGRPHGRPSTAVKHAACIQELYAQGVSKSEIARHLCIGRTSVRRMLEGKMGDKGQSKGRRHTRQTQG